MKKISSLVLAAMVSVLSTASPVAAATAPVVPPVIPFTAKFQQINIGVNVRCTSDRSAITATFSSHVDPRTLTVGNVFVLGPDDLPLAGNFTFLDIHNLKKNLSVGSKGDDVKKLQVFLYTLGYLPHSKPTGLFASGTKKALMAWQKSLGIKATGVYDLTTLNYANVLVFTPTDPLEEDSVYSIVATTGIKDDHGKPLSKLFKKSFVTYPYCTNSIGSLGERGLQGIQGIEGIQGMQSLPGLQGATGTQGIQGLPGLQGATGTTGLEGERGMGGPGGTGGAAGAQGPIGASGGSLEATIPHATLKDMTNQTISDTSMPQAVVFHENTETYLIDHSTTDNPSRIYPVDPGRYRITTSVQLSGGGVYAIWLRKNGVDVPETARLMTIQNGYGEITMIYVRDSVPGDYFEIMQSASVPGTGITGVSGLTDPIAPDAPAVILHMVRTGGSI